MRYIDTTTLYAKSANWGNPEELWTDDMLKKDFINHFHNKCWYTEASLAGHDKPIDHFRPKAKIDAFGNFDFNKPIASLGYDWLKNDYSNYRVCCTYANRKTHGGGKGCFFPLMNNTYLSKNGNEQECPVLLDPLKKEDVKLLSFFKGDVNTASANYNDYKRVEASKKIYNLSHTDFIQDRIKIWEAVNQYIEQFKRNHDKISLFENLNKVISRKGYFSACAISAVRSLAPDEIQEQLDLEL